MVQSGYTYIPACTYHVDSYVLIGAYIYKHLDIYIISMIISTSVITYAYVYKNNDVYQNTFYVCCFLS